MTTRTTGRLFAPAALMLLAVWPLAGCTKSEADGKTPATPRPLAIAIESAPAQARALPRMLEVTGTLNADAETAVREVVGKMRMDSALAEERDQIGPRVRTLMQAILDRYRVGVEVVGINLQQGGVRPPEQVQAAFDDVLRAGQERERIKNEAQAYANDIIPRARGAAARLKEESEGYKARIVAQAEGDAQRFKSILAEYQRAPQVTRDRMYLDTMQQIFSNTSKVMVDSKAGSNLLYLPLDKLIAQVAATEGRAASVNPPPPTAVLRESGLYISML